MRNEERYGPLPVGPAVPDWTPRPRPPRLVLEGRWARLEPLDAAVHAVPLFDANALDTSGRMWTYLSSGPFADLEQYRHWVDESSRSTDPIFFAIVDRRSDRAVGVCSYMRIEPAHGVIEVGHLAYSPLLQRTSAATDAMYVMMRQAFALGYRRYEWKCDALNAASRRSALRLGFTFEGIFRQAIVYKGRSRDTAWYSILDREWPELDAEFQRWLDPANFDAEGRQRSPLAASAITAGRRPPTEVTALATYTVYWQPGCTSCLKTKEFLRSHGIEFDSVNVREQPGAMAVLAELGVRSVPAVVRGREYVLGQNIDDVARFVGVAVERKVLPDQVLAARLMALLDLAAHYTRRLPDALLGTTLPGRTRRYLDLVYHVPMIVIAMLDAAAGGCLTFEHFKRKPPERVRTSADAAAVTKRTSQAFADWWAANRSRLPGRLDTFYGEQPFSVALERTVWHVAQHVRQLESILQGVGVSPEPPIPHALLEGLPLPTDVWDEEMPMPRGLS